MHDDGELARDRHAGLLAPDPLGELHAPRPQRRPFLVTRRCALAAS
jgi:hypothetical protein